jgi:hypothetical protein
MVSQKTFDKLKKINGTIEAFLEDNTLSGESSSKNAKDNQGFELDYVKESGTKNYHFELRPDSNNVSENYKI